MGIASSKQDDRVVIHADGACHGNPGPGGYGAVLEFRGKKRRVSGGEPKTTNNRMELMAVIAALESLKGSWLVTVVSDSQYVVKGITEWITGWEKRGWRTADKKPVLNADLWQRLAAVAGRYEIEWRWVRGHAGDAGNEEAHVLATKAASKCP